jgi:hypothetical protein
VTLSDFCKKIYHKNHVYTSQGIFAENLFSSAGNNSCGIEYLKKLFNGSKILTVDTRRAFPTPIKTKELSGFFDKYISADILPLVMSRFSIPDAIPKNKNLFIELLCQQFQNIVAVNAPDDVENIVLRVYPSAINAPNPVEIIATGRLTSLYPNDTYFENSKTATNELTVGRYAKFIHTWTIANYGYVDWNNRKFEFIGEQKLAFPTETTINVPDTKKGSTANITTEIAARQIEGRYELKWRLLDEHGNDCFPGRTPLQLIVNVDSRKNTAAEVKHDS